MKRLAMVAAGGLISMLPSIASARPHFFFGFGLPVPRVPFAFFAPPVVCAPAPVVVAAPQCAVPEVVVAAPAPACVSAPAVIYASAPAWRYSYCYAPHYVYHYTYAAPARGCVVYHHWR